MILAIDVGNTNIVVGFGDSSDGMYKGRLTTIKNGTATEYAIRLKAMLDLYRISSNDLEGAIISSVVPEVTYALEKAVEALIGKLPVVVVHTLDTGLNIAIDQPKTLGADRIVGSVAAINEYPLPLAIVDVGTATTIDVVDENRTYLGGCIMPGPKTALNALSMNASQLPHIEIEAPTSMIGKNTVDSMRSGIVFGCAAMIEGLISNIEKELGKKLTVIATGGLSKKLIACCNRDIIYDEDLLIKGLLIIYFRNIK